MQTGKVGFGAERIAASILKGQDQPMPVEITVVVAHAGLEIAVVLSVAKQPYAPILIISGWEILICSRAKHR